MTDQTVKCQKDRVEKSFIEVRTSKIKCAINGTNARDRKEHKSRASIDAGRHHLADSNSLGDSESLLPGRI